MKARSKSWQLEPGYFPCKCGTQASWCRNLGSGERKSYKHNTPAGDLCPEWQWQDGVERTRRICEKAGVPA